MSNPATAQPAVDKLLPCPFCGGRAKKADASDYVADGDRFMLGCDSCTIGIRGESWAVVTAKWNTRPTQAAEIERLRGAAQKAFAVLKIDQRLRSVDEECDAATELYAALAEKGSGQLRWPPGEGKEKILCWCKTDAYYCLDEPPCVAARTALGEGKA